MDLLKAYDCVNHDLIIAKLEAYGITKNSLRLIQNYLSQRKQRVRVGSSYSEWVEIILGVPQRSILEPILFNVFINDLLLFIKETDICNFADNTTLFACGKELDTISFKLEIETNTVIQWLKDVSFKIPKHWKEHVFWWKNHSIIRYSWPTWNYPGQKY